MEMYFAYGSCMSSRDFRRTTRNCIDLGIAELKGYKLGFNAYSVKRKGGVLDIEEFCEDSVFGVLYIITDEEMEAVDRREGKKYKKICVKVIHDGKEKIAYTYVIKEKKTTATSRDYAKIAYIAMMNRKFPKTYINEYVDLVKESMEYKGGE